MKKKLSYEELEKRVDALEKAAADGRKMEAALLTEKNFFDSLIDSLPGIFYLFDDDDNFLRWNRNLETVSGYSAEEISRMSPLDFFSQTDRHRVAESTHAVFVNGKSMIEADFVSKDGRKTPYYLTGERVSINAKNHLVGMGVDLSSRKKAEAALRDSDRKVRALFDHTFQFIGLMTVNGILLEANRASLELGGFGPQDVLGKPFWEIPWWSHSIDLQEKVKTSIHQAAGGKFVRFEAYYPGPDGSNRYIDVSIKPVMDENGSVCYLIPEGRDITDRKNTEKALTESEEKYRMLVENASDAIFIAQDEVVKFANPITEALTGYSEAELAAIPFVNLIHPEDRQLVLDRHKQRLSGKVLPAIYSFRIFNKAGETSWVQLNTVLIVWEKRPATLNFLRDITRLRRMEEQLHAAQKMEALGTLSGGIAHDFNNLLMGIQGNASLIVHNKDSSHPDYGKVKNIEKYIQNGAALTRQLLNLAKGGKYELKSLDLNELLEETSQMFGRTRKDIHIQKRYQEDIWPIEADPGQIRQVFLNIYVNAGQAMPDSGEMVLETRNVILEKSHLASFELAPGRYVKASVKDTGSGMDETVKKRAFEPFFTTKGLGSGTGLGLASAHGIVTNHKGAIHIDSRVGAGTVISIYMPVSGKGVVKETVLPREVLRGSETVLVVDDEEMIVDIGEQLLNELGYRVLKAQSGAEAVDIYQKQMTAIDIVLLDVIMPGMSGTEIYDRLKKINPAVKVLLASGYSLEGHAKEILNRGGNGFLQKPFNIQELSAKLREILKA